MSGSTLEAATSARAAHGADPPRPPVGRLDVLAWLAGIYLLAPLVVFAVSWLAPVPGVLVLAAVGAALVALGRPDVRDRSWIRLVLITGAVGLAWTLLNGIVGAFALPTFDFAKHLAILGHLERSGWPTRVSVPGGDESYLRYYLGWYLFPALAGKVFGGALMLRVATEVWTAVGVGLAIAMIVRHARVRAVQVATAIGFILFSGMDLLGGWVTEGIVGYSRFGDFTHVEVWSSPYQYSSHMTQLLWVPQHAISGWLGVLLVLESARRRQPLVLVVALFATLFWSPFAAIGLLPFVVVASIRALRARVTWTRVDVLGPAAFVVVGAVVVALYLTAASGDIPRGWAWEPAFAQDPGFPGLYVLFVVFEAVALFVLAALAGARPDWAAWTALGSLVLLPLVTYGDYNDLSRRASIPALAVLAIFVLRAAFSPEVDGGRRFVRPWRVVLWIALATAAVTSVVEVATRRDLDGFRSSTKCRLVQQACSGVGPTSLEQYLAPTDDPTLDWLLR